MASKGGFPLPVDRHGIDHDPALWRDPDRFDPDRFAIAEVHGVPAAAASTRAPR